MSERERFEKWRDGLLLPPDCALSGYMWEGWQARADLAAERERELRAVIREAIKRLAATGPGSARSLLIQALATKQQKQSYEIDEVRYVLMRLWSDFDSRGLYGADLLNPDRAEVKAMRQDYRDHLQKLKEQSDDT